MSRSLSDTGSVDGVRRSVEDQIRAAESSGAFTNLPGSGKPLQLNDDDDPDWWVKGLIRREQIDVTALLHPTIALRREADAFPESLAGMRTERQVRAALGDFNNRVKADWGSPVLGPTPAIVARQVSVERMVARWRELRKQIDEAEAIVAEAAPAAAPAMQPVTRRWRRRRRPVGGSS